MKRKKVKPLPFTFETMTKEQKAEFDRLCEAGLKALKPQFDAIANSERITAADLATRVGLKEY
jgi:hypothetical protein